MECGGMGWDRIGCGGVCSRSRGGGDRMNGGDVD